MSDVSINLQQSSPFAFSLRTPKLADAAHMGELARSLPELDEYATYLYLLLCDHFGDTCVIAEQAGRLAGFVTGYRKPNARDTLFVWQVAIAPEARGRGLATSLLTHVLTRTTSTDIRQLETTVAPDNLASRRLFAALARQLNAPLRELPGYHAGLFSSSHHAEPLLRVGPFEGGPLAM